MTPSQLRIRVVSERISWVLEMLRAIRGLPLETYEQFCSDPRNLVSAESYLRRGLDAILDLGRHILAKAFGMAVSEYKEIAKELVLKGVLTEDEAALMRLFAGYRNRMVHFYYEISSEELHSICKLQLEDVELVLKALSQWIRDNPDKIDHSL
jgi:uncharacterized protein YutE (UPF0331/DUF86 family)